MGCSGCKRSINSNPNAPAPLTTASSIGGVMKNLGAAAVSNPNAFRWFRDGITGIVKCVLGQQAYSDADIVKNRDVCRNCEFATKDGNGKLTNQSQCMRPDPEKNNAPCGCFITCKTQVGSCDKWTTLTINNNNIKPILNSDTSTEIQGIISIWRH